MLDKIRYRQHSALPKNARLVIYGASGGGAETFDLLSSVRKDIEVVAFADTYKRGSFLGKEILSPEDLAERQDDFDAVLVCSMHVLEITKLLEEKGVRNYIHSPWPQLHYYVFTPEEMNSREDDIEYIKGRLHTDKDVQLFEFLLNLRTLDSEYGSLGIRWDGLPLLKIKEEARFLETFSEHTRDKYFKFVNLSQVENVVQAGLYDGREAAELMERCPGIRKMLGFEPRGDTFLTAENRKTLQKHPTFELVSKGLWDAHGWFVFSAQTLQKDRPGKEGGEDCFEVCSLAEELPRHHMDRLDFLFCDIEDSEMPMLNGGWDIIVRDRPQLALCFYHSKAQFIDIPLKLMTGLENYVFRLGHYADVVEESVIYAIPEELYSE